MPENIDKDTITLDITDFTYEIEKEDILKVIIEVNLKAKEIIKNDREDLEDEISKQEEIFEKPNEQIDESIVDEATEEIRNDQDKKDEDYITYHVHIYKEGEDLESICSKYKSNINILKDYNDINNLKDNDKLIIPEEDE